MSGRDRGAATAELAMALPALLAITVGLVWLMSVAMAQMRIVDAARETARALARGEPEASARTMGERVAPSGASLQVVTEGDRVHVTATASVKGPGGLFAFLPGTTVRSEAVTLQEPS